MMENNIHSYQKQIRLTVGKDPMPISDLSNYIEYSKLKDFSFGKPKFKDAKKFIETYEWLGYIGRGRIVYGMWRENKLYGVEVFCPLPILAAKQFPQEIRDKILYLSRGACCLEAGKNAGSMLLGACLRHLKSQGYWLIIAYSDTNAGEGGYLYKASNFVYAGETKSAGTTYVKINGKWYSPKSLYNTFKTTDYKSLNVEKVKQDTSNKKRWIYILNKEILNYIPKSWQNKEG